MPNIPNEFNRDETHLDEKNLDDLDGVDWAETLLGPHLGDQLAEENDKIERKGMYSRDWEFVSWNYRESKSFICESCGVDLMDHQGLLHVHHIDHDKSNNDISNLEAVCVLCHAQRHDHMYSQISMTSAQLIKELRSKIQK